jgi:metal-responsive CopG/Arc/MetJ family transcriptional regulator
MKTAISIPDPVFQAAEGLAQRLGMSRSQLYSKAILEFTKSHKNQNITEKLNSIYSDETEFDKELHEMQLRSIPKENW